MSSKFCSRSTAFGTRGLSHAPQHALDFQERAMAGLPRGGKGYKSMGGRMGYSSALTPVGGRSKKSADYSGEPCGTVPG